MLSALAFLAIGAIMGVDTLLLVSIGAVLMAFFFALGTTGSTMFEVRKSIRVMLGTSKQFLKVIPLTTGRFSFVCSGAI